MPLIVCSSHKTIENIYFLFDQKKKKNIKLNRRVRKELNVERRQYDIAFRQVYVGSHLFPIVM